MEAMRERIQLASDRSLTRRPFRVGRGRDRSKIQPLLTPMIDVTFQLLLFLLLVGTFRPPEGQIPAVSPQRAGIALAQRDVAKPIVLTLRRTGDGVAYEMSGLGRRWTSPQELYTGLIACRESLGSDQVAVVVRPGQDVPWNNVVEAVNQAIRAKFRNVGIHPLSP